MRERTFVGSMILAASVVGACGSQGARSEAAPTAAPASIPVAWAASSPRATASGAAPATTRTSDPTARTARPLPNDAPTPPGDYVLSGDVLYGIEPLDLTLTVRAEGWISWGPGVVTSEPNMRDQVGVGFADVANLYVDPCRWVRAGLQAPAIGGRVEDLVAGLAKQARFSASTPVDVTLGGFKGRYLELTIDPGLDFATCDQGTVHSWMDVHGDSRYYQGPGQVEQFWILDIQGTRLVVEGSYFPQASAQDRAELAAIIGSIRIDVR